MNSRSLLRDVKGGVNIESRAELGISMPNEREPIDEQPEDEKSEGAGRREFLKVAGAAAAAGAAGIGASRLSLRLGRTDDAV